MRSAVALAFGRDALKHSTENKLVQGKHGVPVCAAQQPFGIERGCLPNHGAGGIARHLKFQPGVAREFHLRGQPQTVIGLDRLYTPEVHRIANAQ